MLSGESEDSSKSSHDLLFRPILTLYPGRH